MEAVVALSLGCNVLQLVGEAVKTGKFICEVYENGKIPGRDQLGEKSAQLSELSRVATKLAEQQQASSPSPDDERKKLSGILLSCANDADVLQKQLKTFETSRRHWQRLKFGLKAAVKDMPSQIREVRDRLDDNRSWLDSAVLHILALDVQRLISQQEVTYQSLDAASKNYLQQIHVGFAQLEAAQERTEANIASHIDQRLFSQAQEQKKLTSQTHSAQDRQQSRTKLLESLQYNGMHERVNFLTRGEQRTFDWILDPQPHHSDHSFAAWLLDDKAMYWIQGQAGSGKSTLMKRIWDDKKLQVLIARNDTDLPSHVLKHSFWLPAKDAMRKNYKGMLCSILQRLLSNSESATNRLLEQNPDLKSFETTGDWSEENLEAAIFDLLADRNNFGYKCIFLDALDEIESRTDHRKVLRFIDKLSDYEKFRTKTCVSSRPERPWTEAFRDKPQLRLQDLTRSDIKLYATKALTNVLPSDETECDHIPYAQFLEEFVQKSEGVFLWAHLAITALLRSTAHASWQEINDLLRTLSTEMEDLYNQILSKRAKDIDSVKDEAATYLALCLEGSYGRSFFRYDKQSEGFLLHQALPIWREYFRGDASYSRLCDQDTLRKDYWRLEERISDICAGLLTPRYRSSIEGSSLRTYADGRWHEWRSTRPQVMSGDDLDIVLFTFAHRTAADFFTDAPKGRAFIRRCPLPPPAVLMAQIDAEMMRWRLWYGSESIYSRWPFTALVDTLEGVREFSKAFPDIITDQVVSQAVRRINDEIADLPSPTLTDAEADLLDTASVRVFSFAKTQDRRHGAHFFAFDTEGLLLELGVDAYFKSHLQDVLEGDVSGKRSLSMTYKNYLLMCSIRGNLPEVARCLVENGADPYAEHYLPVYMPMKTSAAGQLLIMANWQPHRFTPSVVAKWANVLSFCTPRTQHIFLCPLWNTQLVGPDMPKFAPFRAFEQDIDPLMFILDVSAQLNLWLRDFTDTENTFAQVGVDDNVGFVVMADSNTFELTFQPLYARSWSGFVNQCKTDNRSFPGALPFYCCRCLADEGDGLWKLLAAAGYLETFHSGCHYSDHNSGRQVGPPDLSQQDQEKSTEKEHKLTQWEWRSKVSESFKKALYERDFLRDPSDQRVLQRPLRVFERQQDAKQR